MSHRKNFEVQDLSHKYGTKMVGYVALEPIRKGEIIFACDVPNCMYKDSETRFSRAQIDAMISEHPEWKDYIYRYHFILDDDVFGVPRYYKTLGVTCECPFVNHSCAPNCEYGTYESQYPLIASRDIEAGEELCIHYGAHDTEYSLIVGLKCGCGSANCLGVLAFDYWRDPAFQAKYEHCMSSYVKGKVAQLRKKEKSTSSEHVVNE